MATKSKQGRVGDPINPAIAARARVKAMATKKTLLTWDSQVPGFGLRTTAAGTQSWIFQYRLWGGRERRGTIGPYDSWPPKAAREEASSWRHMVSLGKDPQEDKDSARGSITLGALCARFMLEVAPTKRQSTQASYKWAINSYILPSLGGGTALSSVTHDDLAKLQKSVAAKSPSSANWVVCAVRGMFNWANKLDPPLLVDTPHLDLKLADMPKRKRYLSPDEYARLMPAIEAHPHKIATGVIRLWVLTGCRFNEALQATWTQFDLDRGIWTKPAAAVKQAREHIAPISPAAVTVLRETKAFVMSHGVESPYVFPCLRTNAHRYDDKQTPHTTETDDQIRKAWAQICDAAGIMGVRPHDIRHSFASVLVNKGLALPVIGELLGHARPETTSRYAHLYDATTRAATEMVAGAILKAQSPPPA